MTKNQLVTVSLAVLLLLGLPAFAGDKTEGEIAVGATSVDTEQNQNRAGEYYPLDDSAVLLGWFDVDFGENRNLELDLEFLDSEEQHHGLLFNSRSFLFSADYRKFEHNLPHDPLTNLQGWDGEGKIIQHTDMDPDAMYGIGFEEGEAEAVFRPVSARAWEVALKARQINRSGSYQHKSTDHCYSCHIVGQTQHVDADLNDITVQVAYRKQNWGVTYAVTSRDYQDDAGAISRIFDPAHHPAKTVGTTLQPLPVFGNRVQYGVTPTGVPIYDDLAVGLATEFDRTSHVFSGYWEGRKNHFDASLAYYTVESDDNTLYGGINTGYEYEYQSLRARWVHMFNEKTRLRLKTRFDSIDTDDAQIPITENLALAGPHAGQTYAEAYPDVVDLLEELSVRKSAADRDVWSAKADLTMVLGERRDQRLNFSLERNDVDRDNFVVTDDGGTSTTEYILGARFRGRTADRKIRYLLAAEYLEADDPFTAVDGGCREPGTDPLVAAGSSDPLGALNFPWNTMQYFQMHETRFANLSNVPTKAVSLRTNLNIVTSPTSNLTVHGRFTNKTNDETQVSDWTSDTAEFGGYFWWSPNPKLYAIASGEVLLQEQETHVCIPLFNG